MTPKTGNAIGDGFELLTFQLNWVSFGVSNSIRHRHCNKQKRTGLHAAAATTTIETFYYNHVFSFFTDDMCKNNDKTG